MQYCADLYRKVYMKCISGHVRFSAIGKKKKRFIAIGNNVVMHEGLLTKMSLSKGSGTNMTDKVNANLLNQ